MDLKRVYQSLKAGRFPRPGDVPPVFLKLFAEVAALRGKVSPLSSLERMITALHHRRPDRIPVSPIVAAAGRQLVDISYPDFSRSAKSAAEVFTAGLDFIGGDIVILLWDLSVEAGDHGQKLIFPENSTAQPDYNDLFVKSVADYRKVKPVALKDTYRMQEFVKLCDIMVKNAGRLTLVVGFVFGPLGVLGMMRGARDFLKDCVNHPREVRRALEAITESLIPFVEAQCDTGVQAVAIDTLFSSHSGISKDLWNELEAPLVGELARAIRKKGCIVGTHNCGHGPYFDAILKATEARFFSFAHLPDDCASEKELKEKYGRDIVLVGYVNTPLLSYATPYEVINECRRQIEVFGKDGGYVLAPGCEYPPNISLLNALAIVRAAHKYG